MSWVEYDNLHAVAGNGTGWAWGGRWLGFYHQGQLREMIPVELSSPCGASRALFWLLPDGLTEEEEALYRLGGVRTLPLPPLRVGP